MKYNESVLRYWQAHYVKDGACALCGNKGVIRATNGDENYCICPNGQALRSAPEVVEIEDARREIEITR